MLQMGYTIGAVMTYFALVMAFDIPLNFFVGWLIKRIGARSVMILANLSVILYFLVFYTLTPDNWPLLIILAVLSAVYDTLFYVSHIYLFMNSETKGADQNKDVGYFYIVKQLAGLMGPAIGALVLLVFNKEALIIISIIVFALSIIPLYKMTHTEDKPRELDLGFKKFFKSPIERKNYLSHSLIGIHFDNETLIWPLFIFIIFGTIESVALVPIILSVTVIIFSYLIGGVKSMSHEKMIILGSLLTLVIWILRMSIENHTFYYLSIFIAGVSTLLLIIPLSSYQFERARLIKNTLTASVYRNVFSMTGKLFMYTTLAIVINVFNVSFQLAVYSLLALMVLNGIYLRKTKTYQDLDA